MFTASRLEFVGSIPQFAHFSDCAQIRRPVDEELKARKEEDKKVQEALADLAQSILGDFRLLSKQAHLLDFETPR